MEINFTNNFKRAAKTIANIYNARWGVELFSNALGRT